MAKTMAKTVANEKNPGPFSSPEFTTPAVAAAYNEVAQLLRANGVRAPGNIEAAFAELAEELGTIRLRAFHPDEKGGAAVRPIITSGPQG